MLLWYAIHFSNILFVRKLLGSQYQLTPWWNEQLAWLPHPYPKEWLTQDKMPAVLQYYWYIFMILWYDTTILSGGLVVWVMWCKYDTRLPAAPIHPFTSPTHKLLHISPNFHFHICVCNDIHISISKVWQKNWPKSELKILMLQQLCTNVHFANSLKIVWSFTKLKQNWVYCQSFKCW